MRPRLRARVHADLRRPPRAGAPALPRTRGSGGGRLRTRRHPRLLVRSDRRRRCAPLAGRRNRPPDALRVAGTRLRGAVLVPRVHRQPAEGLRDPIAGGPRRAVPGARGPPASGLHHGRLGDRAAGPALQLQICAGLGDRADAAACVRGTKVHSVRTDGALGRAGCPRLAPTARRDCRAGASRMNDALVTFS